MESFTNHCIGIKLFVSEKSVKGMLLTMVESWNSCDTAGAIKRWWKVQASTHAMILITLLALLGLKYPLAVAQICKFYFHVWKLNSTSPTTSLIGFTKCLSDINKDKHNRDFFCILCILFIRCSNASCSDTTFAWVYFEKVYLRVFFKFMPN